MLGARLRRAKKMKKKKYYLLFLIIITKLLTSCSLNRNEYLLIQVWSLNPRSLIVNRDNLGKLIIVSNKYEFIQNVNTLEYSDYIRFPKTGIFKILTIKYFNYLYGSIKVIDLSNSCNIQYQKRKNSLIVIIDNIEYIFIKEKEQYVK